MSKNKAWRTLGRVMTKPFFAQAIPDKVFETRQKDSKKRY